MPDHFFALSQRSSSFHDQLIVYDTVSVATSMILAKHLLDQAFRECSFACLLVPPRLASSLLVGLLFSASSVYEPILKTIAVENITNWGKTTCFFQVPINPNFQTVQSIQLSI
ncbi:hypothetical protein AMECASPLE_039639 [Ameca splendens]|uniref:Uncharacterized protein n=1 Tax=Ameca splendens TaxID=208324 RepID=A0ABV0YX62_9TELE